MVVGAVALGLLTGGCNSHLTGGLGMREEVVYFAPSASPADHVTALRRCSGLPGTTAEPLPGPGAPSSSRYYDVRFRVDHANDFQLNQLFECLYRQPGVVGVGESNPTE